MSNVELCAWVESVQKNTTTLFSEEPNVVDNETDASVLAVNDVEPVAVTVVVVDLKKFPAVNVPFVQSFTTSFVTVSAVPVHSRIA